MKQQLIIGFLIFLLFDEIMLGQELSLPIQNYTSLQYAAASQNWDIAVDELGIIYAANNEGLLTYDGQQWELHRLKSGSIIRSVFPHKDRIYTGSYHEFGYWKRDKKGSLNYTSLIHLLKEHQMKNEEIWDILSFQGSIYFRTFGGVYRYNGSIIEPVQDIVTNSFLEYKNNLLVAVGQQGLFCLSKDGDFQLLDGQELIRGQTVLDLGLDGDEIILGTRNALYRYKDGKVIPFENIALNKLVERYEFNHILMINEREFVIGTVKNGLIHYDQISKEIRIYNRIKGLQNNTVLGVAYRNGKIWLALDNGIDRINLASPIKFYTDGSGELGAVYDLAFHKDDFFLASNTGVYRLTGQDLMLIEGSEGHSWNLELINGELYSNHNTGTYRIISNKFVPVDKRTGSFTMMTHPEEPNSVIIGTYTGLAIYSSQKRQLNELPQVNFPVKKVLLENNDVLWSAHPYEGLYRIGINKKSEVSFVEPVKDEKGRVNFRADIFKINNQIAIFKDNNWFRYNVFLDSIMVFEELEPFKEHRLLLENKGKYWFTNTSTNSVVFTDFQKAKLNFHFKELNSRLVKGNEKMVSVNDSIYYITLNDGFGEINLNELYRVKENEILSKPIIFGISDVKETYDLTQVPSIPFKNAREINIRVGLPDSDATNFIYQLEGENNFRGNITNGAINFQNLSFGNYELFLYALSPQGKSSEVTSLEFEVLPPWYFSQAMRISYFLLFLCSIGLIYLYNRRKLKNHRLYLEQKFQKDHEERLHKLEKERLLNEINSKRKELANTTMAGAKKNEVLMEIQSELNKDKEKFSNQFRIKHIMNKINHAIKSKDEWKLFETNFNELHEDFSRDLLKSYPKLSNKDLKLCSYLKMNLSSKEIAPLMGISVRGVEVHRYRLRKKMGLDSKENLTNFLIKNF